MARHNSVVVYEVSTAVNDHTSLVLLEILNVMRAISVYEVNATFINQEVR